MPDPTLASLIPEPACVTLAKARDALGIPQPMGYGAYVKQLAPVMPPGFFGEVRFAYQDGRFVMAVVEERAKP